jgi:hypothetical protein
LPLTLIILLMTLSFRQLLMPAIFAFAIASCHFSPDAASFRHTSFAFDSAGY